MIWLIPVSNDIIQLVYLYTSGWHDSLVTIYGMSMEPDPGR